MTVRKNSGKGELVALAVGSDLAVGVGVVGAVVESREVGAPKVRRPGRQPDPVPDHETAALERARGEAAYQRLLTHRLTQECRLALTSQQMAFAYEWFRDGARNVVPVAAAQRAGYRGKHLALTASRLMTHPGIMAAMSELAGVLASDAALDRSWVRRKLAELVDISLASVPVLDRSGKPTGEYRVDGATAARCLELLGKDAGMFAQQVKVTHGGEVVHLLRAVAERGKPALEARRPRVIDAQVTDSTEDKPDAAGVIPDLGA